MATTAATTIPPQHSSLWQRIFLRPSLFLCFITILAYWDEKALNGGLVYDDGGSLKNNGVVSGKHPWRDVLTRDFWGTPMSEPQSHKSFRPITTLSFRANWKLAEKNGQDPTDHTFGFHVVNVVLHGMVTGLTVETAAFVFHESTPTTIIVGAIFGLHPVHAEAVTNITSRGELLMSLFFLLAFLSFATSVQEQQQQHSTIIKTMGVYMVPWICMFLSVFCKEQGATALVTIVVYDFLRLDYSNVHEFFLKLLGEREPRAVAFLKRTLVFAVQSAVVVGFRVWLNGESSPDFIYDQNPAAFSKDRFTRVFSTSWVYCLYIYDAVVPVALAPDWSGLGIDLITSTYDIRILGVLTLWTCTGACLYSLFFGTPSQSRKIVLMAFFGFLFSPFLLSSNLLVVTGLMKADRVIYLPLLGFAMMEALLFQQLFLGQTSKTNAAATKQQQQVSPSLLFLLGYVALMGHLTWLGARLHERNIAWSNSLDLWTHAYLINNKSHHTMYNCGYELSVKNRHKEAEYVMRPIGDPRVDGPSNTFVYAMVLYNLDRCAESKPLVKDALAVIEEKRQAAGIRDTESSLSRSASNLIVADAYCMIKDGLKIAAKRFYDAVQMDPTNQYAVDQAMSIMKKLEAAGVLLN